MLIWKACANVIILYQYEMPKQIYTRAHAHTRAGLCIHWWRCYRAMLAEGERTVAAREGASDYRLKAK